jgi:hypothetical protein
MPSLRGQKFSVLKTNDRLKNRALLPNNTDTILSQYLRKQLLKEDKNKAPGSI